MEKFNYSNRMLNFLFFINNVTDLMKTALRFQVTECDCGIVSLFSVISYLFDREELPAK